MCTVPASWSLRVFAVFGMCYLTWQMSEIESKANVTILLRSLTSNIACHLIPIPVEDTNYCLRSIAAAITKMYHAPC